MIQSMIIRAYRRPGGDLSVRVSYSDDLTTELFPPVRFWRGSTSSGSEMGHGPREALFWVMEACADINYGPSEGGEEDPDLEGDGMLDTFPASWAKLRRT